MAKVGFFSVPAHGHVNPTLPIVARLVREGEQVIYYGHSDFRASIEATGAEFREFFARFKYNHRQVAPSLVHLAAGLMDFSLDVLPETLAILEREQFDYLIHDCIAPWARFAGDLTGVPRVVSFCLIPLRRRFLTRYIARRTILRQASRGILAFSQLQRLGWRARRKYGLSRLGMFDVLSNEGGLNLVYTSREFQPHAELFDDTFRFVGPPLPEVEPGAQFPFELLAGRKVVYIALGTHRSELPEFFRICLKTFADRPEMFVMATGGRVSPESLGAAPANFIVRSWVPQVELLKRAQLYINHGGVNGCTQAIYFGVPQLVYPLAPDLQLQARRVEELGAGRVLKRRELMAGRLREIAIEVLESPAIRSTTESLQRSMRAAGGSERAVREVLAFRDRTSATGVGP